VAAWMDVGVAGRAVVIGAGEPEQGRIGENFVHGSRLRFGWSCLVGSGPLRKGIKIRI
jgi:hypothetical protein